MQCYTTGSQYVYLVRTKFDHAYIFPNVEITIVLVFVSLVVGERKRGARSAEEHKRFMLTKTNEKKFREHHEESSFPRKRFARTM